MSQTIMSVKNYRDLVVWQRAMDLVVLIYQLVKILPREEMYALSDQMRRSAVSIPSNIAEGQSRYSVREFIRFLYVARGLHAELETQLLICIRLKYLTDEQAKPALELCSEVGKMLNGLIDKL